MWKKVSRKNDDTTMEDVEEEQPSETTNHSAKTVKNNETAKDNDNSQSTKEASQHHTITIRFKFNANSQLEAIEQHKRIISVFKTELGTIQIINNDGKTGDELDPDTIVYHPTGRNKKHFVAIHGIICASKYFAIKRNKKIFETLKTIKCYMQLHLWKEDEWDIVNLGFISGASPRHQSKTALKQKISDESPSEPNYELGASNIYMTVNNSALTTFAYEIKCKRNDINKVSAHIAKQVKQLDLVLIKHQWKFTNPEIYSNGIKKQIEFIGNIRTVPIYGITSEAMIPLYPELMTNENILDICSTARTNSHGRWNVYTPNMNFESTTKWLQRNLSTMYHNKCDISKFTTPVPETFKVEVKFNTEIDFSTKKQDPLITDAEASVSKYSNSSAYSQSHSWASIARNANSTGYSYQTSQATSYLSTTTNISKTIETINKSIERLHERLTQIEHTLKSHNQNIEHFQLFKQETTTHMTRISNTLEKLEERTNYVQPRQLDRSFETESNKRRDIRSSPGKGGRE